MLHVSCCTLVVARLSSSYLSQSRFLVEGDATKHFSVKKGNFSEKGGDNSVNQGLVRISTGKAIQ